MGCKYASLLLVLSNYDKYMYIIWIILIEFWWLLMYYININGIINIYILQQAFAAGKFGPKIVGIYGNSIPQYRVVFTKCYFLWPNIDVKCHFFFSAFFDWYFNQTEVLT